MFNISENADISGTSLKGYLYATYPELKTLFGEASLGDDYKVSGQWVFEDDDGNVFTVYDYKQTELYDPELESVRRFRSSTNKTEFHVGGRGSVSTFMNWIEYKLAKLRLDSVVEKEFNVHVKSGLGS